MTIAEPRPVVVSEFSLRKWLASWEGLSAATLCFDLELEFFNDEVVTSIEKLTLLLSVAPFGPC